MANQPATQPRSLIRTVSDIIIKQLDTYFGTEEVLGPWRRLGWTVAGTLTTLSFKFTWIKQDSWHAFEGWLKSLAGYIEDINEYSADQSPTEFLSELFTGVSFAQGFMFLIFALSPFLLATAASKSISHGRPLRFFLLGFLVYGVLLISVDVNISTLEEKCLQRMSEEGCQELQQMSEAMFEELLERHP